MSTAMLIVPSQTNMLLWSRISLTLSVHYLESCSTLYMIICRRKRLRHREDSWYSRQLPNISFRKLLFEDMPWLLEAKGLPIQGFDWHQMYRMVKGCWQKFERVEELKEDLGGCE